MIYSALLYDRHVRRSLFHRRLYFMEIIAKGNNGEENRQNTCQGNDALRSTRVSRMFRPTGEVAEEKGITRDGDDGPNEVKCEFH
jgi:hypothetical protein